MSFSSSAHLLHGSCQLGKLFCASFPPARSVRHINYCCICYVSIYTWVSLLSLFTLPAISAISSRDTHIPISSRGPTRTGFSRQARWPCDAADQTRCSFQFGVKELSQDALAQTDCSHQRPHLHICKCRQQLLDDMLLHWCWNLTNTIKLFIVNRYWEQRGKDKTWPQDRMTMGSCYLLLNTYFFCNGRRQNKSVSINLMFWSNTAWGQMWLL